MDFFAIQNFESEKAFSIIDKQQNELSAIASTSLPK